MRTRKPAGVRKLEIVDAAIRLADELGPDRVTTEAVGRAVGLTQPGVFRHFPRKTDLWEAVAARIGAKMEGRWQKARDADAGALAELRSVVATQLALIRSMPAVPAILFSRELHAENESLREAFFKLMGRFHQLLAELVTTARDNGDLRSDIDADGVAFLILALVQGLAVRWSLSGRAFDLSAEGRHLLELQLSGFASMRKTGVAKRSGP